MKVVWFVLHINDTISHSKANYGTPDDGERNGACDPEKQAPIHNYMNYVDDEWMNEFTPEQGERLKKMVLMYRPGLIN